jgi:transposase
LKNRIHSMLTAFGKSCPMSDLFGVAGRELLDSLAVSEPWRGNVDASLLLIDEIATLTRELKRLGAHHRYVPMLMTAPGVGWLVGFPIATEIGNIKRFSSPRELCGYTREGRAWPPTLPAASSGLDSS